MRYAEFIVQRRRCREKTAKGNVYRSRKCAEREAMRLRRETREGRIHTFRCPICDQWHVGKRARKP